MKFKTHNASSADSDARIALLKYSAACPICGAVNMHYRLNPRLFFFDRQDVDLQPRQFKHVPGYENLHPPCYHVWHCPACFFAADFKYFNDPFKDMLISPDVVRQRLRDVAQNNTAYRSVLNLLGRNIDEQHPGFFQAIKLNLLAIHVFDQILALLKQHYLVQARYCQQLGWLFRDLAERPKEQQRVAPELDDLMRQLRVHWPTAPANESDALHLALAFYTLALEDAGTVKTAVARVAIWQQMARVHCKLGEFQQARELLGDSMRMAQEACAVLDRELKAPRSPDDMLTPEQSGEMVSQNRRLEALVQDAESLIAVVYDKNSDAQVAKARSLMAGMSGAAPEQIRAMLARNRIDASVIARLVPKPAKKGLFGF